MPRNAFDATTIRELNGMVFQGATCCDIAMKHNVLCSKHVFQNAVRCARADARVDQARAVRDVANTSKTWSTAIHLNFDNVFVEAFFVNSVLLARRLDVSFVLRLHGVCLFICSFLAAVSLHQKTENDATHI